VKRPGLRDVGKALDTFEYNFTQVAPEWDR
jgi:hypothetical protein